MMTSEPLPITSGGQWDGRACLKGQKQMSSSAKSLECMYYAQAAASDFNAAYWLGNNEVKADYVFELALSQFRKAADALGFDLVERKPATETNPAVIGINAQCDTPDNPTEAHHGPQRF